MWKREEIHGKRPLYIYNDRNLYQCWITETHVEKKST